MVVGWTMVWSVEVVLGRRMWKFVHGGNPFLFGFFDDLILHI